MCFDYYQHWKVCTVLEEMVVLLPMSLLGLLLGFLPLVVLVDGVPSAAHRHCLGDLRLHLVPTSVLWVLVSLVLLILWSPLL